MIKLVMFSQDKMNWLMAGFIFLWLIGMIVLHTKIKSKLKGNEPLCNLLCEVPLFVCILHYIVYSFKGRMMLSVLTYGGFYLMAIMVALLPLFMKVINKRIVNIITVLMGVISCFYTVAYPAIANCSGTRNYTHMDYVEAFNSMMNTMKEYDTLLEWKNIDMKQIKADILPMIQEAEEKHDQALFYVALCKYTYLFYDGHTWVNLRNPKAQKEAEEILAGNDYGLSMIRLSNGETVATLVEENSEASKNGIETGTRIIKWNGENIDEAIDKVECIYTKEYGRWPVKENEDMFKPIFLAGKGDDQIEVTFITSDNTEKTVNLTAIGKYRDRLERACEILLAKDKLIGLKNFDTYMINDTFGYLRISDEEYMLLSDIKGYLTGSDKAVRDMFDNKINGLVKKGMKKLIIDVRNNTGGYSNIVLELTSLFTKEDIYINSMAYMHNGKKEILRDEYVNANGKYSDIEVIVLTNARCVSSGDYLVYSMGQCQNVKVVGITVSTGSSQPIGGNCVMSDGICEVKYPQNWMITETGERFIDTKEDRISQLVLDERIPLTKQSVLDMYENGSDYELQYITGK